MFGSRRFTEKMQKRVKVSLSSVKQDKPSDEKKAEEASCPPPAQPELSLPPSSGPGDKKKLVTQDTLDSARLSQTPSVSSEDALSPVVRRECFHPDARPDSTQCIHLFIYSSLLQIVDQEQSTRQHLMLSRKLTIGCPQFPFRGTCSPSAQERGSWDCWQPCYLQPNQ